MIIRKYGLELHRLTQSDIELVRQMRNRDDIRRNMIDQHLITPEEQVRWFQSINNMNNYYFVVHYLGKKVGLIYGKNMDWEKRENEAGIFIWEPALIGSAIPTIASILMMELSYRIVQLERTFARINPDNTRTRHYNLAMGYVPTEAPNLLVLTRENFLRKADYLRRLASRGKDTTPLSMNDIEIPFREESRHLYENLPQDLVKRLQLARV